MDAESDDSERWEDFYGSSTELEELVSIFDALSNSLEAEMNNNNNQGNINIPSQELQNGITHTEEKFITPNKNTYLSPLNKRRSLQQSPPVTKSSCRNRQSEPVANIKHRNNIRLLSANVQRIIAHSDAQHVGTINLEALQQPTVEDEPCSLVKTPPQNLRKKPSPIPASGNGNGHKSKLSNIPLSKGAEKLTMAGNELVDTFDSSTEYLDTLMCAKNEPLLSTYKHVSVSDDEKTPTNTSKPFTFELSPSKEKPSIGGHSTPQYIELLEIKQLAATTQLLSALSISPISKPKDQNKTVEKEKGREVKTSHNEVNRSRIRIQAVNTSLVNNSIVFNSIKAISRSQSLAHPRTSDKDSSFCPTTPVPPPSAKSFPTLEQPENGSTESLDRLTEMKSKFPTKEPQKMATLLLPEINKLKHRPLSSSSLCSTTSSSSSGSDNLNNKLSTSYLASVESLADHSESESTEQQASMSVLERSCLEIVDSERNYVEDLRQVITGYLCDWKERACLRVDELKVLFSNIEEIYDFSSLLLKQLIDSAMDPVKIAQCFISMRESFNVYTKYCTSYPEAISLLTKLLQSTHTNALLTSTQKMLQHTLPLGSYLLKPVQRILKYHLLLDNLRKHCDVKEAFQAYEIMRQVARNIDQVKRRLEQQSRVKELSGILDGWLGPELTVLGELRLEGLLMDHNKPRMVFLFATMLIITKPKEDNRLQFKSYIHQNNLMLNEHLPGEPTSFYVIPYDEPRNQIKLTAKNRDQKRVWTQQIKEAMLEKFENISSRAKELVYQLGDEEDRTSGKNSWKWTMNSTSMTPIYLERRNQYRRSELRNRFKLKRKSVADLSFANSGSSKEQLAEDESTKAPKPLTRKNSLDETMVPMLLRFTTAVRQKRLNTTSEGYSDVSQVTEKNHLSRETHNDSVQQKESRTKSRHSPKLKERSKSVPRINVQVDEKEPNSQNDNESHLAPAKSMDIKQYNHKTMPKRVATIKKQKNSNSSKRDTFKFYMDISEFDVADETTVLKITESSENLSRPQGDEVDNKMHLHSKSVGDFNQIPKEIEHEMEMGIKSTPKVKRDAQIVFDLLKDSKEFERICNKPQRKRSSDVNGQRQSSSVEISDKPPPPPSTSPPLLEIETEEKKVNHTKTKEQGNDEEHIYETLLRNVHVPYKFSPDFRRSKSVQYTSRSEERSLPPRPESDYVVLKYAADETLLRVESKKELNNTQVSPADQHPHALVDEQSNKDATKDSQSIQSTITTTPEETTTVSDEKNMPSSCQYQEETKEKDPQSTDQKPAGLVKRFLIAKNGYRISSLENISNAFLARGSRRKSTDNNARYNSGTNRPPERRASDVSEMCRVAMIHRQGSEAVGERMAYLDYADPRTLFNVAKHLQRDSSFSLTSSNDSVCGHNNRSAKSSNNFEYEEEVEDNLERDFRDSAIYSDDNEKRVDCDNEHVKEEFESEVSPVRISQKPPKLPPKPPRLKALASPPGTVVCPPHLDKTAARSWVLQQIENFSK